MTSWSVRRRLLFNQMLLSALQKNTKSRKNNLQLTSPSRAHLDEFINERVGEVLIQLEVIVFKYILVNITEYYQSLRGSIRLPKLEHRKLEGNVTPNE